MKGWFKYMTDCKNFPDHLIYSSRKMAASRTEFEPANSWCDSSDTKPLTTTIWSLR
jgi:hypothetical protein